MTWIAYRGFRPTSKFIGLVWMGRTLIGVEVSTDAFGFVFWNCWMGVMME
jgi:hypothetical protein